MVIGTKEDERCNRGQDEDLLGVGCCGDLHYPPSENCSCHISPPCGSCISILLECDVCGWVEGDD